MLKVRVSFQTGFKFLSMVLEVTALWPWRNLAKGSLLPMEEIRKYEDTIKILEKRETKRETKREIRQEKEKKKKKKKSIEIQGRKERSEEGKESIMKGNAERKVPFKSAASKFLAQMSLILSAALGSLTYLHPGGATNGGIVPGAPLYF